MERCKKNDFLEAVETLIRANDLIGGAAFENLLGATDVLVLCQESAVWMGTYFEELDGEYGSLIKILEDYCEDIYQINVHCSDENRCRKLIKKIRKQLTLLQNMIISEIPDDKKEVVFLPYKASVWDSLESIWKAAEEDESTDTYVIPIPYYDKNPDGSFRERHYEGNLYPDYVPITMYDEYDFEVRRPDVIFIHNPYDEGNYVTSVHPFFYSRNLKQYTDKLIYVPYFVLGDIDPENQEAVDGMKQFCFLAGVVYSHKVIVQSEKMRQIYVNEYIKAAQDAGLSGEHVDRNFLEKKILGFGSPKVDKVVNTRKSDIEIPEEWMKIIRKPDGSWKKIVLYNTGITALLQHNEQMLAKMKDVFHTFCENRDEIALFWRPHPLIESTLTSMRPQLWESYKKIKNQYLEEGWGIYDDTANLDRAIEMSDAYYGDHSSVVRLYQETNKPVIIQNINVDNKF